MQNFSKSSQMKILMVGIGYVGEQILQQFQNHQVVVTTTSEEKVEKLKSLSSEVFLLPDFPGSLFDVVIVTVAPKRGTSYAETYLKTAQMLIKNLKRPLPFLIYTSSTSVYEGNTGDVTEEVLLKSHLENSRILQSTEELLLEHFKENACILRLGGIYGQGREIAKRALYFSGKKMQTTGKEPTNHIHRDDIVRAVLFCMQKRCSGVYNLVNDSHPSRKELYEKLCAHQHLPLPIFGNEEEKGYRVSNAKIKAEGFTFQHETLE